MIVTTSLSMDRDLVQQAVLAADELAALYVERQKYTMSRLLEEYGRVLLVAREGLSLHLEDGQRLHFHPDTAALRLKAPRDPLVELLGQAPKRILDCTLGLGSDSLVMAGSGHEVTGLESEKLLHFLVANGLSTYQAKDEKLTRAMRSIQTFCVESQQFLQQAADASYDVVYLDPMFSEVIEESDNLKPLSLLANHGRLTAEWLEEAKRVAKETVILKAHFRDPIFEELGFDRKVRPYQKFHYGVIEVEK